MNNKGPKAEDYLYHYTSIETLALILKERTVRFNSLDKMDDRQEQMTADINNIGQFCYVSSWTDDADESIPMWNMYATLDSGIRIRLRKNPFKIYDNCADDLKNILKGLIIDNTKNQSIKSIIPLREIFSKGFICPQAMDISYNFLFKVSYTDEQDKLYPTLLNTNGNQITVALDKLGKYKNPNWKFQKEWRYILLFLPVNLNQSVTSSLDDFYTCANDVVKGRARQPFLYYDMKISDDAFENMQITLSPKISAGNRIIVQSLLEKYNPSAALIESCLNNLM